MRPGGEKRGNSYARRARKVNLLRRHGDGDQCPCSYCGDALTFSTVEADRVQEGGPYRLDNVIPACRDCNLSRSNQPIEIYAAKCATVAYLLLALYQMKGAR